MKNKGILKDNRIKRKGFVTEKKHPSETCLIKYKNPESGNVYERITNNFAIVAKTIAECFKKRGQIKLFFKWIQQNLKIKKIMELEKKPYIIKFGQHS